MKPRREADILRAILAHCNRLPGVMLWRANRGAITATYKGTTRFVRFGGLPGMSDLIGWKTWTPRRDAVGHILVLPPLAVFVAIEVKRPGMKPTPQQAAFLELVRQAGGLAIVATSVEDVIAAGLR